MISPILFEFGSFRITYYALVYVFGALAVLFMLRKARKVIGLSEGGIYDLVVLMIVGAIVGARIFHILFWDLEYFASNLVEVFFIWEGGLSFHGGLTGVGLAAWFYSRKKKVSLMKIADIVVLPAVLFLALGRIANFINQEIVGRITDVSWCVNFRFDEGCRHPVQLYAAGGRFLLFLFLLLLNDLKKLKEGFIFWNFVFFIGIGRFVLDFWREGVQHLGLLSGQWLGLIMFVVSGVVLWKEYK